MQDDDPPHFGQFIRPVLQKIQHYHVIINMSQKPFEAQCCLCGNTYSKFSDAKMYPRNLDMKFLTFIIYLQAAFTVLNKGLFLNSARISA